eukprot:CAMPEP_0167748876 /NCGR_PEP_ID=MMETSP0110_2-20121227/5082_1 /TAXON_ID=629695 /ORGANISM="Gymnochlora sp., Strain CCMP2014" /LENGTH=152 /DNA_ID=CAMNT_0007633941 /DNA_START=225 /DNA_END=683 /DNA_ORIENTATION=+
MKPERNLNSQIITLIPPKLKRKKKRVRPKLKAPMLLTEGSVNESACESIFLPEPPTPSIALSKRSALTQEPRTQKKKINKYKRNEKSLAESGSTKKHDLSWIKKEWIEEKADTGKRTADGLRILSLDTLFAQNKPCSGKTPLCPFDCDCCFI